MLTVLVVEDHALVREGLLGAVKGLADKVTALGASDANEAIEVLEKTDVDLLLLDLMLPGTGGLKFLPVVRRRFPTVPVVVLSAKDDADTVAAVMRNGASGFVSKASSGMQLLDALRCVQNGEVFVSPAIRDAATRSEIAHQGGNRVGSRSPVAKYGLTPAQARVLELLIEGRGNRQMAELLGVSEGTVKIHVSAILKALKVTNRAEAVALMSKRAGRS